MKPGVSISAPTANFTATPTSGQVPLSVSFSDSSSGGPSFWAWDFGDGTSSTVQSPTHSYTSAGTYTVTLVVNNGYGSDSLVRNDYITVTNLPPAPVADFSGTPTFGIAPLAVSFTDSSTNAPTSWSWTFGDGGSSSTAQNPSHTYNAVNNYTVALTATNAGGNNTMTKTNYVAVCTEVTVFPNTMDPIRSGAGHDRHRLARGRAHRQRDLSRHAERRPTTRTGAATTSPSPTPAANLARMYVEYKWEGSRTDTPDYMIRCGTSHDHTW